MDVFSAAEIDQFVERGHVMLKGAFPRSVAEAAVEVVWEHMPFDRDDPSTWTKSFFHVQENFDGGPFAATWTDRVHAGFDQLLGSSRWRSRAAQGWWPVLFPGHDEGPWRPVENEVHIDGQQFHHHVDSPDQALVPCFVFSDVGPDDGGTAIFEGSHRLTARILADAEPAGLSSHDLSQRVKAAVDVAPIEVTGEAGDVIMMHPFMLHGRSTNLGPKVRFITNPCISLHEPMRLDPPQSPVERAIAEALVT